MKKRVIYFLIIFISVFFSISCNRYAAKEPKLTFEVDSVNYVVGLLYGDLVQHDLYYSSHNEENMKSFFMGLQEGFKEDFDEENLSSYLSGIEMGINAKTNEVSGIFGDSTVALDASILRQATINFLQGDESQMSNQEAEVLLNNIFDKKQKEQIRVERRKLEEKYKENKEAGEEFLERNAKNPRINVLNSGLQYEILNEGTGDKPTETDIVKIHYVISLIDGTILENNYETEIVEIQANSSIKAWEEALPLMNEGAKWRIYAPQELAYGMYSPSEEIKPFSTLIFDIELLEIVK